MLSWGFATLGVALGSALDSTEGLWHLSLKRSGGRPYARRLTGAFRPPRCLADVPLEEEAKPPKASPVVKQMRRKSLRKCKIEEFETLGIRKFDKFKFVETFFR